jgi:dynein heavy chain
MNRNSDMVLGLNLHCYSVLLLSLEKLKLGLSTETRAWRLCYGKHCNAVYRVKMNEIFELIDDIGKRLSRPIKDLDDIRFVMAALKELRDNEIRIDMTIGPIEVSRVF